MKINKKYLKFKRDTKYIQEVFDKIFKNFDESKLEIMDGYVYDNQVSICREYHLDDHSTHYLVKIGKETFFDSTPVSWIKEVYRIDVFEDIFTRIDALYQSAYRINKEAKRKEILSKL